MEREIRVQRRNKGRGRQQENNQERDGENDEIINSVWEKESKIFKRQKKYKVRNIKGKNSDKQVVIGNENGDNIRWDSDEKDW